MMAFSDQICEWISQHYECPECGKQNWKILTGETMITESQQIKIARYDAVAVLDEIKKVYLEAEEYIYISCPWFSEDYVKEDINLMRNAIKKGVHIFLLLRI